MAKRKPVVFHNGSKYDHHFIIKEQKKYITFTVPIEKEVTKIYKSGEKISITYYNLLIAQDLW